ALLDHRIIFFRAADLTLRCCLPERDSKDATKQAGKENPCLEGFAIATCCHHLC
ncbi:hypothetical protein LINPERHAP2_LOCUS33581, partial [Linum perenne]